MLLDETAQLKSSPTIIEPKPEYAINSEFFQLDDDTILAPFVNVDQLEFVISRLTNLKSRVNQILKRKRGNRDDTDSYEHEDLLDLFGE